MRDKDKIIELLEGFSANDYGEFLLENSTKDFLFIRPSGNPIDASGFMKNGNFSWLILRGIYGY